MFNSEKREIASIQTLHNGMGFFDFVPEEKTHYVVVKRGKKEYKFNLPNPLQTGYNLNLTEQSDAQRKIIIQKTADIPDDTIGIAITCRGKVILFETIDNRQLPLSLQIDENELPEGVNRLTLFDTKGEILSDRLFFVNRKQPENLIITLDKNTVRDF